MMVNASLVGSFALGKKWLAISKIGDDKCLGCFFFKNVFNGPTQVPFLFIFGSFQTQILHKKMQASTG